MVEKKGPGLEELVRGYFARQGFYALRGVPLRFEDEDVTDIDVWLYGRHSTSVRTRAIVDVKDKRSPKAFERILWARGLQLTLGCDRAIVATPDNNPKVVRFAHQQKVSLLSKAFLGRLEKIIDNSTRLTSEQFTACVREYASHKQDGDWVKTIADAKSALISLHGYPAFNKAISAFKFFAQRAETRPQHAEQALRGVYLTASLACIALDSALERVLYEDSASRYKAIADGVTYGDAGDAKVQNSISTVLEVMAGGMQNGRVIAQQTKEALQRMFESVRADVIAEHFQREHNAAPLFAAAKDLDDRAHSLSWPCPQPISSEVKTILGVFADFTQTKRVVILGDSRPPDSEASSGSLVDPPPTEPEAPSQSKLI
jgi:hypothetical protein